MTRELHPHGAWKGIIVDPPSVPLKGGAHGGGGDDKVLEQPGLEPLERGVVIDLFGGSERGEERPSRSEPH